MRNYAKGWADLNSQKITIEHKILVALIPIILLITYYFESL